MAYPGLRININKLSAVALTMEAKNHTCFLKKYKMWDTVTDTNKSLWVVGISAQAKKIATNKQQIEDLQAKIVANSTNLCCILGILSYAAGSYFAALLA